MFVGHALLAFALAALAARRLGRSRERALAVGVAAGAFATVPDVDMIYAPVGLAGADGAVDAASGFWAASTLVHRGLTHSVLVGVIAAAAFALWAVGARRRGDAATTVRTATTAAVARGGALAVLVGLVGIAAATSGALGAVVVVAFVAAGLLVTNAAVRLGDLSPAGVFAVAAFGLASHPFGDLFTGTPPGFLAPLEITLIAERVTLSPDPTLHVLGAFGIEIAVIWLAAAVYCRLTDRRLPRYVHGRAALGIAYAGVALLVPPPTLDRSYPFVLSVLAVGIVGPAPLVWRARAAVGSASSPVGAHCDDRRTRASGGQPSRARAVGTRCRRAVTGDGALAVALTGLATVTLAALSYTGVYLLG